MSLGRGHAVYEDLVGLVVRLGFGRGHVEWRWDSDWIYSHHFQSFSDFHHKYIFLNLPQRIVCTVVSNRRGYKIRLKTKAKWACPNRLSIMYIHEKFKLECLYPNHLPKCSDHHFLLENIKYLWVTINMYLFYSLKKKISWRSTGCWWSVTRYATV